MFELILHRLIEKIYLSIKKQVKMQNINLHSLTFLAAFGVKICKFELHVFLINSGNYGMETNRC